VVTHKDVWGRNLQKHTFVSNYAEVVLNILKKYRVNKVLDLGCGNGCGSTIPLLKAGYDVYGVELTKEGVEAFKRNLKREGFEPKIKRGNFYAPLDFPDGSFDAVVCVQAIYHGTREQILYTFREVRRVLRLGGVFIANFIRWEDLRYDRQRRAHFLRVVLEDGREIKSWYRRAEKHLMYSVNEDFEFGVPHYFFSRNELERSLSRFFKVIDIFPFKAKNHSYWFAECLRG